MPLKPPPRLQNPPDMGSFAPGDSDQPSASPQDGASPAPGESQPGAMEDMENILAITGAARRIATKYPTAVPEIQTINDAVQKLQMKIMMVQPPGEVAAPPQ